MQLSLNNESSLPLVDQIVGGIRHLIEDRVLRPGMQLPPIRRFAEDHKVSRFTVVEAYDRLVALNFLQSRRSSGFYVALRQEATVPAKGGNETGRAFDNVGMMYQSLDNSDDRCKVGVGWLPPEWLDEEGIRRNLRLLARRNDTRIVAYGTPRGYRPLREQLQIKLGGIGIGAAPEQIVLTHGATQALDLVARYLLKAGDCVFVDDPGYWNLFSMLRLHGVNLIGVPHNHEGPDPVALETLLAEHRPRVFFTHSVLHNPTACSLSPASAFRILQLAEKHDFLIIEDDTYADFCPRASTRLAELDQLRRVIYVGSFAKTLSASLRVGFIACDLELAATLTDVKIISCIASSEFAERLVYQMLTEGHYRKFMARIHNRLAEATNSTLKLLEKSGMRIYAEPAGGMFVWAEAPGLSDSSRLASQAAQSGIMLAPGNIFRPQTQPSPWLRFNVAYSLDPKLERFLGETLTK